MNQLALILPIFIFASALLPNQCESSTKVQAADSQIFLLEFALYRLGTDVHRLPTTEEGLKTIVDPDKSMIGWQGPYLNKLLPKDPWENDYQYYYPPKYGNGKFDLYSFCVNGKDWNKGDGSL